MLSKSVIIIVPGAFCVPEIYEEVADRLRHIGHNVCTAALATVGEIDAKCNSATMQQDSASISHLIEEQADQGHTIVLLMHSYGGIAGTEATKGLSVGERQQVGKSGGIVKLIYVAALVARLHESPSDLMGSFQLSGLRYKDGMVIINRIIARQTFFSSLGHGPALLLASKLLPISDKVFTDCATWEGYRHTPCAYFVARLDKALPPSIQWQCLTTLKALAPSVDVFEHDTDHFPWNSCPDLVVECLHKAINEYGPVE